jgi:Fe-S-cluster-containing dehydrogenase component/DMSO reductase anchor subunit
MTSALLDPTRTDREPIASTAPRLIADYLDQQRSLTAVERFAQRHAEADEPLQARYYRDLIPLETPKAGQQYAFEVDLDRCSGCKSCVAACHELNGLDDDETWRSVGLLLGGTPALPVLQHVTSACHHCLDPACLYGCPVKAYEKDPVTGIVKHLDDQCIGCQYCIFKCPYDVPKYNKARGIVRKCDMCSDRLAAGEAPACVQACPTQAIRITVVDQRTVIEDSEANVFLPGAPEPHYTLPTTTYKSARPLPRNLLPTDYYAVTPGHVHAALVAMLVLTQMSVGTFVADWVLDAFGDGTEPGAWPIRAIAALLVGLLGMGASIGHLGRPLYAFRAVIGLRTSWLSREILAFGLFALFAALYGGAVGLGDLGLVVPVPRDILRGAAAISGVVGVLCSVMIYADTRRPFWSPSATAIKFVATALVLGLPAVVLASLVGAMVAEGVSVAGVMSRLARPALRSLQGAAGVKLAAEALVLLHLRDKQHTPLKRTALLLVGELRPVFQARLLLGLAGGVVLPALLLGPLGTAGAGATCALVALMLGLLLAGEVVERTLFFTAVVAPRMPGALSA